MKFLIIILIFTFSWLEASIYPAQNIPSYGKIEYAGAIENYGSGADINAHFSNANNNGCGLTIHNGSIVCSGNSISFSGVTFN